MSGRDALLRRFDGRDAGLLFIRVAGGVSLFLLFGLTKVRDASHFAATGQWSFADFNRRLGIPAPVAVAFIQTWNESGGALLVAVGLLTRLSASALAFGFAAATLCSLRASEPSWMLAGYLATIFATISLAGPGRYSFDRLISMRSRPRAHGGE